MIGLAATVFLPVACRETGGAPGGAASPPVKGGAPEGDEAFLGLGEAEGAALAKERKLVSRVVSVDGKPRPATRDYRPDRVSFEIEGGRIVRTTRG